MRTICVFFVLICLCVGCKSINKHTGAGSQQIDKITSGTIVNDKLLPETGAQRIKPPKEMRKSEPKKLNAMNAPKALMPNKSTEPKALMPKGSEEPKSLISGAGNF
jgi:uncharacterized protein YceK